MFIDAKEFLETMRFVPSWINLGGKTEKAQANRRKEFGDLENDARRVLDKRSDLLFYLGSCIVLLVIAFVALCYGVGTIRVAIEQPVSKMSLAIPTAMSLFFTSTMLLIIVWIQQFNRKPAIRLDQFQKMLLDDIVYLMQPIWMPSKLDWVFMGEEKAKEAWLGYLRNLAAKITSLEHKLSLLDYPEKEQDEWELERDRESLDELYRILRQFKMVSIEKGELFEAVQRIG